MRLRIGHCICFHSERNPQDPEVHPCSSHSQQHHRHIPNPLPGTTSQFNFSFKLVQHFLIIASKQMLKNSGNDMQPWSNSLLDRKQFSWSMSPSQWLLLVIHGAQWQYDVNWEHSVMYIIPKVVMDCMEYIWSQI